MIGKILRWGNSYGIRLSKADVERRGLREGQEVFVEPKPRDDKTIDLGWLRPVMADGRIARDHDKMDWA